MRKTQENKYTMMKAVEALLDERPTIVSSVAELQQHHNSLKTLCTQISAKEEEKRCQYI